MSTVDSSAQYAMSCHKPAAYSTAASALRASASNGGPDERATASAASAASVRGPGSSALSLPAAYTSSSATARSVPEQTICSPREPRSEISSSALATASRFNNDASNTVGARRAANTTVGAPLVVASTKSSPRQSTASIGELP